MSNIFNKKAIFSASLGNVFEAYDLSCFLFLSPLIAKTFFPAENLAINILKVFAVFFVGFIVRPLGGLILGRVADVFGRKLALLSSILLASVSTFLLVCLPSYASIGVMASILLLVIRILQSFAFGGEYITSVVFIIEHAPQNKKAFYGSFAAMGANVGVFFAAALSGFVFYCLEHFPFMQAYWRLPFLFSFFGVVFSYWMRRSIPETKAFIFDESENTLPPLKKSFKLFFESHQKSIFLIIFLSALSATSYYSLFSALPLMQIQNASLHHALQLFSTMISVFFLALFAPLAGYLADRFGMKRILFSSSILFIVFSYPYFYYFQQANFKAIFIWQILMVVPGSGFYSVVLSYIAELVPLRLRCALGGFLYSLSAGVFGGAAPIMMASLISWKGPSMGPAFYLMGVASLTVLTLTLHRP